MIRRCCSWIAALLAIVSTSFAEPVDYLRQIKPIFEHHCYACHGALKQESELRLDTGAAIRRGSAEHAVIVPGHPKQSRLVDVVARQGDLKMPPEGEGTPLNAEEIELIRRWIADGAISPDDESPQRDPREHWSYQPVRRPTVPAVTRAEWVRNPIDAFIAAKHDQHGLAPQPEADRAVWLRRVTLDLTGLPPTPQELAGFLADARPDACDRVVDRLLDSPAYGQRWGRHWMDVWRYSDWYGSRGGNEMRYSQRHIWRWRDWIIESLNSDRGYNVMVQQMLAGDELSPGDLDVTRATGFIGRNWYKFDRNVWMFDTVEHTAQAFLGMTLKCCRCHDHKYDPLSQTDYYRFRAYFEPHDVRTDPLTGDLSTEKDATLGAVLKTGVATVYDKSLETPTYVFQRGDNRYPDESRPQTPGVPTALGVEAPSIEPVPMPLTAWFPSLQPSVLDGLRRDAARKVETARKELQSASDGLERASLELELGEEREAASDADAALKRTRVVAAAERRLRLALLDVAVAEVNDLAQRSTIAAERVRAAVLSADLPSAALAIEAFHHARVAAQAQRKRTLAQAERDLLAAEQATAALAETSFKTDEARTKAMKETEQRRSAAQKALETARQALAKNDANYAPLGPTYPQFSSGRRTALAKWIIDPRNPRTARVAVNHIWLRHFGEALVPTVANFGLNGQSPTHPELLDWLAAEFVDHGWSMKHLHRLIVTSATYRMTAHDADAEENRRLDPTNRFYWQMNSRRLEAEAIRDSVWFLADRLDDRFGGPEIAESQGEQSPRRSLYFRSTPNEKMNFLEFFDRANPNECYRRQESVVPQQALALSNSVLSLTQAQVIARLVEQDARTVPEEMTRAAFVRVLSRPPTPQEMEMCRELFSRHQHDIAANMLVHVLLNHNDFVTVR